MVSYGAWDSDEMMGVLPKCTASLPNRGHILEYTQGGSRANTRWK
jgi:hypothetical protein